MFKVSDINKSQDVSSASKAKKAQGGASFSSYLTSLKSDTPGVSGPANISVADAIFATQMVDGEEEREIKKKLVKRSSTLIEKLEEIRDGLLIGEISKDKLIEISRFVKDRRFETSDTKLQEIIEEIELRVEVELAKLMR